MSNTELIKEEEIKVRYKLKVHINLDSYREALIIASELRHFARKLEDTPGAKMCHSWADELADLIENK